MKEYNIVIKNTDSTVVAEYISEYKTAKHYQSEAELEKDFIERLKKQGYDFINITSDAELVANLRRQLEKLNDFTFTGNEWNTFFTVIANPNETNEQKTEKIQEGFSAQLLKTDFW
jgi:type I restriction enzyme R subunit